MAKFPVILAGQKVTAGLLTSMLPEIITKPSTTTRTNASILDDPDLSVAVDANAQYIITFELAAGGLIAAGITMQWNIPAGTTGARKVLGPGTAANNVNADNVAVRIGGHNLNSPIGYAGVRNSGASFRIQEIATITTSTTPGFVTLQWGQTTANATGSLIAAGSFVRADRVA